MRRLPLLRLVCAGTAALAGVALGGAPVLASAPVRTTAVAGPAIRITEFAYGGKTSGASKGDGEYAELTNLGDTAQDLAKWTYETGETASATTGLSLADLGSVAPGESVIVTDLSDTEFRNEWGLKTSVKVLSNAKTHTLDSGPNGIHVFDAAGAEVDSVRYASKFQTSKGQAAWVDAAHVGKKADTTGWTLATAGDTEGSWTSASGSVGSPGASTLGSRTPTDVRTSVGGGGAEAPCDTENSGDAPGTVPAAALAWPGSQTPATIDDQCAWVTTESGQDLSGLAFDPTNPNVLYAVKNKSHVYRLVRSGSGWAKDTANGWATGKDLRFPSGSGQPDTEGLTVGPDGALYITTERDNASKNTPRDSILRFDVASTATPLVATDEWPLTPDLDFTSADANLGFEGVAYVPDGFLVGAGFRTDAGVSYDPAAYPKKAVGGLFLGAVEKTGHLRAYVLNTDHTFARVADIDTGLVGVMDASFDPDLGRIWAHCDNTCGNATALLRVGSTGHVVLDHTYKTPTGLPNYNFEGFAVAPSSTANGGTRQVLWTDDGNRFGHSLWAGTLDVDLDASRAVAPTASGLGTLRTTSPTLDGRRRVGQRAHVRPLAWTASGLPVTLSYRWYVGKRLVKATTPSLRLRPAMRHHRVRVEVTGSAPGYATTVLVSERSKRVR